MKASGKFVLRTGVDLHERLKRDAAANAMSLNAWIVRKLTNTESKVSILEKIRGHFGTAVVGLVLFGSEARGERKASSDIDLLIVLDADVPIDRKLYTQWSESIEPTLGPIYSPHFSHLPASNEFSSLWLEVALEGQIMYDDRNAGTRRRLASIRDAIAAGAFKRKMSHGHSYWTRA